MTDEPACISLRPGPVLARIAPALSGGLRERIARAAERAEEDHQVPALLILAVMERESRFAPRARSRRGARGLMQLRARTAAEVARQGGVKWNGPGILDDVETNVDLGTAYLAQMLRRFGNLEGALVAYNSGPARARRALRGPRKLSSSYSRGIVRRLRHLLRGDTCELIIPGGARHR